MFTWICPKCGKEVPPAYDDCPNCNPMPQAASPAPPPEAAPEAPLSAPAADPPLPPPPPRVQAPPPLRGTFAAPPPAPRRGLPTWLMTIVFALATVGIIAAVLWTVGYFKNRPEVKPSTAVESPAAKPGAPTNPFQKFIEVSGIRFSEDPRHKSKILVTCMITNHSQADVSGLAGNVTIWGMTRKADEDAVGTFTFDTAVHPFESKEVTAPLNTKLKIYELPDWQNVTTDLQITGPSQ